MKVAYISFHNTDISEMVGVNKKISWQVGAMRKLGHYVIHGYRKNGNYIFNDGDKVYVIPIKAKRQISIRYTLYVIVRDFIISKKPDMVYLRFAGSDPAFLTLLKAVRNSISKIIIEVPTYPIGKEILSMQWAAIKAKNIKKFLSITLKFVATLLTLWQLKHYVDFIVTYWNLGKIWGIPVIPMDNGVCVDSLPLRKPQPRNRNIILIGVAALSSWHGYDRVISGMAFYMNKRKHLEHPVYFYIAGRGPEEQSLMKLASELGVSEYVKFLGTKTGPELDDLYNLADLAVASLGMHRIGLIEGSTLKTKEYCAKGIPFIYSYRELSIDPEAAFALLLPSDDREVDISEVVKFAKRCRANKKLPGEMRKLALSKYDWTVQLSKIFICCD